MKPSYSFSPILVVSLVSLVLTLQFISGCTGAPKPRPGYYSLPPLENGWGRLFISAGKSSGVRLWSNHQVGPVLVDGKVVGSTAKDEHIAVDLLPGTYEGICTQIDPFNTTSLPVELEVKDGQERYFACDMSFASDPDGVLEELFKPEVLVALSGFAQVSYLIERPLDNPASKLVSYMRYNN